MRHIKNNKSGFVNRQTFFPPQSTKVFARRSQSSEELKSPITKHQKASKVRIVCTEVTNDGIWYLFVHNQASA